MKKSILSLSLLASVIFVGCAPTPTVVHQEQSISSVHTKEYNQISQFAQKLNRSNVETIYIYIDKDGSRNMAGSGAGELPPKVRTLLTSILSDFGQKVQVVDSFATAVSMLQDPEIASQVYVLDGAITRYDKDIMSQSSGFDFGFDFGSGEGEGSSDSDFKDKDKLSILGIDFYLRQGGFIAYKTSSQIDLRTTTRGYSFGVSINKGGIGMSGYKTIKDGVGLSVRKLLQASMYDLIQQVSLNKR
ncbi:MAG: hypothetical protein U9P71_02630 [Campylobacterota bacterium]|nr:hypothetical protein [Campylobacterota bacterium]